MKCYFCGDRVEDTNCLWAWDRDGEDVPVCVSCKNKCKECLNCSDMFVGQGDNCPKCIDGME
jgi:hypothetical protein